MISRPWRVALFLFVAAGLNYADRAALSSVIPPLRADLGITDAQVGIVGMLFLWSYAIASPFAGNLADRLSRPRVVVWSLVAWSVVTIFTGLATSIMALFVLRTALGIAECFYLPAAGALLGEHHGKATLGKAMGFHMLGLNLGLVLGGSLAGLLAEYLGWRFGFWLLGGLGLLLALVSPFFLSGGPAPAAPAAPRPDAPPRPSAWAAWGYLLRVPSFHCLVISAMGAGVASWIFLQWLPLFFAENHGLKLGAAGLAGVALYKAPVFLGIGAGGWLSDVLVRRDARARALIKGLSFIVSSPFLFLMIGAPGFALVAASLMISSAIRALGIPSEHPIICEVVPPPFRATAIGILNTCGSAAGGIGVLLTGFLKQDLGLNLIFGASSFIYVLAGGVMLCSYWFFMERDMAKARAYSTPPSPSP
ncbi:MAG: MFS transporter [Opitutaceae bacterium]|nr:MFS transporter [Opitutaceae bacterium]